MIGNGAIAMSYRPVRQVGVIMMVGIDGQCLTGPSTEQLPVFAAFGNCPRATLTANMAIETYDTIGCRHDQMKIMGDQQNSAIQLIANFGNEIVKCQLPDKVDTLNRFIKNQKIGCAGNGTGKKDPLKFATG